MLYSRFQCLSALAILSIMFASHVQAQAIHQAWTFGNLGSSLYRLDAYDPADTGFGDVGATDPTLALHLGWRYQGHVVNYQMHPLEILASSFLGPFGTQGTVMKLVGAGDNPMVDPGAPGR